MSLFTIEVSEARSAELGAGSWPVALARPIREGLARIGSRRQLRRDIRELMALDDRLLRDIGLSRCDVEHGAQYGRAFERYRGHLNW